MKRARLEALAGIAGLREGRSAARLARIQALVDRIEGKAQALRDVPGADAGDIAGNVMQDRWRRWRDEQLAVLTVQVARLQAAAQPERERHARDVARRAVLEKLAKGPRR